MATYVTVSGDTFDSVAYKTLGDGFLMDKVIAENTRYAEYLVFPAGIKLEIPDLPDNPATDVPEWFE